MLRARGFSVHAPGLAPAAAGFAATTVGDYRERILACGRGLTGALLLAGANLGGRLALAPDRRVSASAR